KERSIPVKLRAATENVATEGADMRTIRIRRENARRRTAESSTVKLEPLIFLCRSRIRIAKEIHATTVASHVKYRATLPGHDVVVLPVTNHCVEAAIHICAITPPSSNGQIPNIRKSEAMPDVRIRAAAVELGSRWIVRTAITRTRTVAAN